MSELGEISRCYTISYERRSSHAPARLWRAITDPGEVAQWMALPARIDLRVGGDYFVEFPESSEDDLDGIIVRIEPERLLALVWGRSVLEWTLEPRDGGTRYTFVHHGMIRRDVPDEEGVAAGWHAWLDDLDGFVAGSQPTPEESGATFEALMPAYRKRLRAALGIE